MKHKPRKEHRDELFYRHTVLPAAKRIADSIIADARNIHGPVVWITGNSYMPPARSFPEFEALYNHRFNGYGEITDALWDEVERHLNDADVYVTSPDYDNALYAVDLARWEYVEDSTGDDLNDEWQPKTEVKAEPSWTYKGVDIFDAAPDTGSKYIAKIGETTLVADTKAAMRALITAELA
jgi:hypothetical protein